LPSFFGGLKKENHRARQVLAHRSEHRRNTHRNRHVQIVPARVEGTRNHGAVGAPRWLVARHRVEFGSIRHDWPRLFTAQHAD
jgi:hypothetical protein